MTLAFIDTETTSLRHDRRAWEIAVITRTDGTDTEHTWFTDISDLDLGNADLISLNIGRFHERHPQMRTDSEKPWGSLSLEVEDEYEILRQVEIITRGAHLAGAVPSFDADVLGQRMRAVGICPSWHYHLIDVEALAVGYLSARTKPGAVRAQVAALPWDSEALSHDVGVDPEDYDRHTALGDARWARAIYDAITKEH